MKKNEEDCADNTYQPVWHTQKQILPQHIVWFKPFNNNINYPLFTEVEVASGGEDFVLISKLITIGII